MRDDPAWNKEILENIILFVPYSFFFLQAFESWRSFKSVFLVMLITSGTIEISQLLFWVGSFQFADIFHNLIGGLLGCGIWFALQKAGSVFRKARR